MWLLFFQSFRVWCVQIYVYICGMIEKDIAIVLQVGAYNDKYSIVQAYTRGHGRVAFMLPLRGSKGLRRSLFAPFSILEVEMVYREGQDMQRVREAHLLVVLDDIQMDAVKLSLTLFLAEVVARSVHEREANVALFDFLMNAIQLLDKMVGGGVANFHLCFLVQLSAYLGFYPNIIGYSGVSYFDMRSGTFVSVRPVHGDVLPPRQGFGFVQLMRMDFSNLHCFKYSREERGAILDAITHYYMIHVTGFGTLRSLEVLKVLFV